MNHEELKTVSGACQSTSLKNCHVKYNVRVVKAKIMNVTKKLDNVNDAVITM
ncbi:MAG: hypothetical protein AAB963_02225 [Patescibacteria group bacterium]